MLNQEERAAKFFDAITKDAEERHEEMTRKTRETVESGLEKAKAKAHSQAQAKIERERMLKEQEFNRTVANERTQQRARLTDKRGAITDEVFGDAREKLTAFTESDGYADFLKKSAAGFARLEFYEMFSRFYEGGGRAFTPAKLEQAQTNIKIKIAGKKAKKALANKD